MMLSFAIHKNKVNEKLFLAEEKNTKHEKGKQ